MLAYIHQQFQKCDAIACLVHLSIPKQSLYIFVSREIYLSFPTDNLEKGPRFDNIYNLMTYIIAIVGHVDMNSQILNMIHIGLFFFSLHKQYYEKANQFITKCSN